MLHGVQYGNIITFRRGAVTLFRTLMRLGCRLLSFQNRIRESQVGPRWAGSGTLSRLTTLFKNQRVARVVNGPRLEPAEKALPKKQFSIRVRHAAKDISKNDVSNF